MPGGLYRYFEIGCLREADGGRYAETYKRLLADGLRGRWPLDETSKHIAADRRVPRNILWNHIVGLLLFQEYVGKDFEPVEREYLAFCQEIAAPNKNRS